jgi:hypothetical protein
VGLEEVADGVYNLYFYSHQIGRYVLKRVDVATYQLETIPREASKTI